ILAAVLERVSEPLKKADLLIVAYYLIGHLPHSQVPILAKRHKIENDKKSNSPQELLAKRVTTYDEAALCRILLEISLLDSAYQRAGTSDDALVTTARRYRVDVEKLRDKVAAEFVAKRTKQSKSKAKEKKSTVAKSRSVSRRSVISTPLS